MSTRLQPALELVGAELELVAAVVELLEPVAGIVEIEPVEIHEHAPVEDAVGRRHVAAFEDLGERAVELRVLGAEPAPDALQALFRSASGRCRRSETYLPSSRLEIAHVTECAYSAFLGACVAGLDLPEECCKQREVSALFGRAVGVHVPPLGRRRSVREVVD